jgi:hypothetical protein
MKQALIGLGVFLALTGTSAAKGGHAMTQAEFRQVLHERDVAYARAWRQTEAAAQMARIAQDRRDLARLKAGEAARDRQYAADQRSFAQDQKVCRDFLAAQSVLTEPEHRAGFGAMQERLERECAAVPGAGCGPAGIAFIRHAWAAHRFNQGN